MGRSPGMGDGGHLAAESEGRRLFVGGLHPTTTDYSLRAHFAQFYPVVEAQVRQAGQLRVYDLCCR